MLKAASCIEFSCESISVFLTPLQVQAARVLRKIFLFPVGRAYFISKNLTTAKHYFLIAPETRSHLTGSDTA